MSEPLRLTDLSQLVALVRSERGLHVRYSEWPKQDASQRSVDTERSSPGTWCSGR